MIPGRGTNESSPRSNKISGDFLTLWLLRSGDFLLVPPGPPGDVSICPLNCVQTKSGAVTQTKSAEGRSGLSRDRSKPCFVVVNEKPFRAHLVTLCTSRKPGGDYSQTVFRPLSTDRSRDHFLRAP